MLFCLSCLGDTFGIFCFRQTSSIASDGSASFSFSFRPPLLACSHLLAKEHFLLVVWFTTGACVAECGQDNRGVSWSLHKVGYQINTYGTVGWFGFLIKLDDVS